MHSFIRSLAVSFCNRLGSGAPARIIGRRSFLALLLLTAMGGAGITAATAAGRTVRLLTVGNSFSQNATHYLGDLAVAAGDVLIHQPIVVGGASLELHATKAQQHEQNPQDKEGRYSDGRSLKEKLRAESWDYVTIQQASIKSHDVETYRPFALQLRDYIKRYSPGAEVLLHQTWEYRSDDPRFSSPAKDGEPASAEAMYQGLAKAYATVARELGLRLIPVGDAFHLANHDPKSGFRQPIHPVEPDTFKSMELPEQTYSLNVGWQWKKQPDNSVKLNYDGHHANLAGEYLGACVWYEVLFEQTVEGNSFVPKGLDPAYAKFLQRTAHRAVVELKASARVVR